ncbi:MAG: helix-turn-helix domain-containing protein [Prevotellaceae bacterium]|jgi:AraC-like DNA-binding protein|nr:helix-turn-helix domain-containing protein [Prevotellaceae bacterium]
MEKNEQWGPDGVADFALSDAKGVPLLPEGHYRIDPALPFFFNGLLMGVCVQGEAAITVNFKHYTLTPGVTLLILPYYLFQFERQSDDFTFEGFYFSFNFFVGLVLPADFKALSQISEQPCLSVAADDVKALRNFYAGIVNQYRRMTQAYRVQVLRGLLYAMLLYIVSIYKGSEQIEYSGTQTRQEEITAKFLTLLNEYYKFHRAVSFYSDKLCVSSKYLSQVVKDTTGRPVHIWIIEQIILESKRLLRTTSMSVYQIAEELHFPNASFFGQYFKKHTGVTPYKFRRS